REGATDAVESVRLNDRCHHVARQRHRYIDAPSRNHRGPVLIAKGMPDLEAARQQDLSRLGEQRAEVDDHDLAQIDPSDQGRPAILVPGQDGAITEYGVAV